MQRSGIRIAGALAIALTAVAGGAETRVTLAPTSTLTLRGKSTLHDYESRATRLDLRVELADEIPAGSTPLSRLAASRAVKSLVLTIPVAGLKSPKDGLDKNMYKALRSSEHPNITFRMTGAPVAAGGPGTLDVSARGELEVAGQRRPIDLELRATTTPEGVFVEGSKALLMSEFGIKPPTMMLGALKTADRVEISFRLLLTVGGL